MAATETLSSCLHSMIQVKSIGKLKSSHATYQQYFDKKYIVYLFYR